MEVETKLLRLFQPAALGDRLDGWRVCWIGGWDKCRILFVVMVERPRPTARLGRGAPNASLDRRRRLASAGQQACDLPLSFDWTSTPAKTAPSRYNQRAGGSHHRISLIDARRFTLNRTVAARTRSDQIADKKHGNGRLADSAENRQDRLPYAGGSRQSSNDEVFATSLDKTPDGSSKLGRCPCIGPVLNGYNPAVLNR